MWGKKASISAFTDVHIYHCDIYGALFDAREMSNDFVDVCNESGPKRQYGSYIPKWLWLLDECSISIKTSPVQRRVGM